MEAAWSHRVDGEKWIQECESQVDVAMCGSAWFEGHPETLVVRFNGSVVAATGRGIVMIDGFESGDTAAWNGERSDP